MIPPEARARSHGPAAVNVRVALLRLALAAASRLAQLLGRPRWAVALVFWLEARRLKFESRGPL